LAKENENLNIRSHYHLLQHDRRRRSHFPAMANQDETSDPNETLSLRTLCTMRSHLLHPSTSKRTVSNILQTLTNSQHPTPHSLKLLSDVAVHHPDLALAAALPAAESSPRLAVEAIGASLSGLHLDDARFTSLCFGASVPARAWMLRNAGWSFQVRPGLLLAVLLGFTKDPYPYVRDAALEGLFGFIERGGELKDVGLVDACYRRAVQLLRDVDPCVRFSAVRVVRFSSAIISFSRQLFISSEFIFTPLPL